MFDKYFNGFRQGLEYKFFCPSCETLIKTSDSLECTVCEEEYERQQLLEKGNFFLYLPIEKQLKDFCQNNGVSKDLDYRCNREKDDDVISDIYDGQMYKSLGNGILTSDRNAMSLSYNCDGVPVFQSSNFSIWPLQAMLKINFLPKRESDMCSLLAYGLVLANQTLQLFWIRLLAEEVGQLLAKHHG